MKKRALIAIGFVALALIVGAVHHAVWPNGRAGAFRNASMHSALPEMQAAKAILNSTHRHREWVSVPAGQSRVRAFIVYPERSDKAPILMISSARQGASDWIRAVADQAAAEGFIAVVPDVLSGLGPYGGDQNAFENPAEVAAALRRLGIAEIGRRTRAVRDYAIALPAANGKSASLEFAGAELSLGDGRIADGHIADSRIDDSRIEAAVESPVAGERSASYQLNRDAWPKVIAFLSKQTGDHPVFGENPNVPEDHSAHFGMAMGQTADPQTKGGGRRGYPIGKLPDLPAGIFNAHSALMNSKLRKEWVDIPMGTVKLHTWVEYPEGDGKAPILIVMQHGPGMDDWQRAVADQLASEGFIAIATDLHSGLGPKGGAFDSFAGTDEVMRATARLTPDDMFNRYKAARDWGMKLPRANGKSASIGFCMGGTNSFRFAAGVPDLDAAVVFYGTPDNQEMLAKIKAPVMAFYGDDDARVTSTMAPTQATMKRDGKWFEAYTYPHATHAFLSYQDLAGNPEATADSWPKAIAFLKSHTM
jgi:carboxymethylenebutenolidase